MPALPVYAALSCTSTFGNHVVAESLELGQKAGLDMAVRVQRREFRQLGPDFAAVGLRLPEAQAALDGQPALEAGRAVDVHAVESLVLGAVVVGVGQVVVGHAEQRRVDVVQIRDGVAAAAGQPRVNRRDDAELPEVVGRHGEVVGDDEALEPAAHVADFDRDARRDLLLHRDAERPVRRPHAPALSGSPDRSCC